MDAKRVREALRESLQQMGENKEKVKFLFVPQLDVKQGFGHLKRILTLIEQLRLDTRIESWLYIRKPITDVHVRTLIAKTLAPKFWIQDFSQQAWQLIVVDMHKSDEQLAKALNRCARVVAIDEGGAGRDLYPYIIDLLPQLQKYRLPNEFELGYLSLPMASKLTRPGSSGLRILLSFGGSDQARLTEVMGNFLESIRYPSHLWSAVKGPMFGRTIAWPGVKILESVNVAQELEHYDVVFTHFGLTAYEALASGCRPILLNPTTHHQELAVQSGFCSLGVMQLNKERMSWIIALLKSNNALQAWGEIDYPKVTLEQKSLAKRLVELSDKVIGCPVCGAQDIQHIMYRTRRKSYAQCAKCQMLYLLYFDEPTITYDANYFDEDYRKQYGKSYLEDFDHIKQMGYDRLLRLSRATKMSLQGKKLLDIGCAYGPFLQAASDVNMQAYGIDTATSAVEYVVNDLGFSAQVAHFPVQLPYEHERFGVVSMWYVIEHFRQLEPVMRAVNRYLESGGVFAFSTPKADGLSARTNLEVFLENSPDDHYAVFRMKGLRSFLERFGFELLHVEVTGVHVVRKFPKIVKGSRIEVLLARVFKWLGWGDTFEVYAIKKRDLEDE